MRYTYFFKATGRCFLPLLTKERSVIHFSWDKIFVGIEFVQFLTKVNAGFD